MARAVEHDVLFQRRERFRHVGLVVTRLHDRLLRRAAAHDKQRRAQAHVRVARDEVQQRRELARRGRLLAEEQIARLRVKQIGARRAVLQLVERRKHRHAGLRHALRRLALACLARRRAQAHALRRVVHADCLDQLQILDRAVIA